MKTIESFEALRRANPRAQAGFREAVDAAAGAARTGMISTAGEPRTAPRAPGRRLLPISVAGVAVTVAAAVGVFLMVGSSGGPGVANAAAAVRKAAALSAASAEQSGTAVVRITHNGKLWAGSTIRWNGADLVVSQDAPRRLGRPGSKLLLADGMMYGIEPLEAGGEGWVVLGSPETIDPGSGTTPADYLAAVREDVGGTTLRRITGGMTGLTTRGLDDGSTVYSGTAAAGLIARETGFKEGQPIRVLPFGYVAHDEAADAAAPLDVAITVGADGIVRQITVTWGTSASAWAYTVAYSGLGTTAVPDAPANAADPIRDRLRARE
jgi:hypothetical protein